MRDRPSTRDPHCPKWCDSHTDGLHRGRLAELPSREGPVLVYLEGETDRRPRIILEHHPRGEGGPCRIALRFTDMPRLLSPIVDAHRQYGPTLRDD